MTVDKVSFDEGDIAVVRVEPADMPPVRYKGRTWIRRGPRRALATPQEERILTEKRLHRARTFDLQPCLGCEEEDLALPLFELDYRNAAIAPDVVSENNRDRLAQMASLGLWDSNYHCSTNAGALLLADSTLNWFPGAYIQYIHFSGDGMDSDPLDEKKFSGDLISMLRTLGDWLENLFPKHPVAVSSLREKMVTPFPVWAVRELLMNAIMHRDYESTMPIRFHRFSDRIEIMSAGGLFGMAPENFPVMTAYRNPKIAEILFNLKYVNRFGYGVQQAQRLLAENGNPSAEFETNEPDYFLVTVYEASS
jgi:ATP-dependent DNA helicase RecG